MDLDGLEVTIVGNIAIRLSQPNSGLHITSAQVSGLAAAMYVLGACLGALAFGWMTDRFGRKKLFMITLATYLVATALTALFIGQAFLYNAITFGFATILETAFHTPSNSTGYYYAVIAAGNLVGPLVLGRLFDTVGRRPMIASTYVTSGVLLLGTAFAFHQGLLSAASLTACWAVALFFASAGASSAYLTVSEVFPLETRALAIAFSMPSARRRAGSAGRCCSQAL